MNFNQLNLIEPLQQALISEGYKEPTPIQEQAIPLILSGHDILGSAQTGTGKTAAFTLPILQLIKQKGIQPGKRNIKALILTPTRELAEQIHDSVRTYGKFLKIKSTVVYGGVSQNPQTAKLRNGVDILIATPGRLLDLMDQGHIDIKTLDFFVLDEADRMLDMGFIHDVKRVIKEIPKQRQTLLFSATMPAQITDLANSILINPVRLAITPVETTVDAIDQSVYFVSKANKINLLSYLLNDKSVKSALVFSRTKHGANKIVKALQQNGIKADAIHGNKSQTARQKALNDFQSKKLRILIATDIAARGIDIDQLSHVINYDLPEVPETYIHRIGRTGRAGLSGKAISFCSQEETKLLLDIERHTYIDIPIVSEHPYAVKYASALPKAPTVIKKTKIKPYRRSRSRR